MSTRGRELLTVGLLLTGCTAGQDGASPAASSAPSSAAPADPGPFEIVTGPPGEGTPLPDIGVFLTGVSAGGTPAAVQQATDSREVAPQLGLGPDPATWRETSLTGIAAGTDVGELVVADDGSVTALALVDRSLAVLRVTATGEVTTTLVPGVDPRTIGSGRPDAVSDDGRTAVVATASASPEDPTSHRIEVTTVDLPTATATATAVVDVPPAGAVTGLPPEAVGVGIGPDGAVTVAVATAPPEGPGEDDGLRLARFAPGLVPQGVLEVDAGARYGTAVLDLTADGTAVVAFELDLPDGTASTRVVRLAPGAEAVETVGDLDGVTVQGLVTGPDGWVHLLLRDDPAGVFAGVAAYWLDDATRADPVAIPRSCQALDITRSGTRSAVVVQVLCSPRGEHLVVLGAP